MFPITTAQAGRFVPIRHPADHRALAPLKRSGGWGVDWARFGLTVCGDSDKNRAAFLTHNNAESGLGQTRLARTDVARCEREAAGQAWCRAVQAGSPLADARGAARWPLIPAR